MALEDNFLGLDGNNYNSEWEYMVTNNYFSLGEVAKLYTQKLITKEEYNYAVDFLRT